MDSDTMAEIENAAYWAQQDTYTLLDELEIKDKRIAELEAERRTIAQYIKDDPPFDTCAGIDLHERASDYAAPEGREGNPSPEHYYKAFIDCCKAAILREK